MSKSVVFIGGARGVIASRGILALGNQSCPDLPLEICGCWCQKVTMPSSVPGSGTPPVKGDVDDEMFSIEVSPGLFGATAKVAVIAAKVTSCARLAAVIIANQQCEWSPLVHGWKDAESLSEWLTEILERCHSPASVIDDALPHGHKQDLEQKRKQER